MVCWALHLRTTVDRVGWQSGSPDGERRAGSLLPCDQPALPELSGKRPCKCVCGPSMHHVGGRASLGFSICLPARAERAKQQGEGGGYPIVGD